MSGTVLGAGDTEKKRQTSLRPCRPSVWWEDGHEIRKTTTQISFSVLVVTGALKAKDGKLEQCGEESF